ncbi:MAG: RNA polymerase sigma-70 factor [Odoribacter splanchnicus]
MLHRPCLKSMDDAFRLYYRPLCLYALHYLNNIEDAEDTVQDCFAELWEHINNGRMVSDLKSYLYSMTRNHCIDRLKKDSVINSNVTLMALADEISDEECEERSFIEARLWTAIDSLPERCRESLLLCKRDGLKYEEIAKQQGVSVNTVKNQISKALKVLKEEGQRIYIFFFG